MPLDPIPSSLVLSPTNHKSIVGHYRGRGPGGGAQQESETADGGADIVVESQGGSECTLNVAARLSRRPVQVEVPAESGADVSAHSL